MKKNEILKFYYDETSPISIEEYAKGLIGQTFYDVLVAYFDDDAGDLEEILRYFDNPRSKGNLGNLIQEYYFGIPPNSSPEPDFEKAGVELKVTPYELNKKGEVRAGERLVIGMIPNDRPVPECFEDSHLFDKLQLVLLILYLRDKNLNRTQYRIDYTQMFQLSSEILREDLAVIKSDYEIIVGKIRDGRAHEISEADTMYLGACTKGATAKRSLQSQYYNPDIKAKRRAFSLKQSYMSVVINKYVLTNAKTYDAITQKAVNQADFEHLVNEKIAAYIGLSEQELREVFDLTASKSKDLFSQITLRMLDVKSDTAEEFAKSNTQIKTVRIEENGRIKEHMSFPYTPFEQIVEEDWEFSEVYEMLSETKFLFVFYRKRDGAYYLDSSMFWNMPNQILESRVKEEWLLYKNKIISGINFSISKNHIANDLPKASQTHIIHMRPHASKAAYLIDNIPYGNGVLSRDADRLPNGDWMTKQCFWLNKEYIEEIYQSHQV